MIKSFLKDKRIIFKYRDSKIVKSAKDNKILKKCTVDDLKEGITHAFNVNMNKDKINLMNYLVTLIRRSKETREKPKVNLTSRNTRSVDVDVRTEDGRLYIVYIRSNGEGVVHNRSNLDEKIIFCKAVSHFYKNWETKIPDVNYD